MRIAIIGGGLAGCAAAWRLKQAGHEPVIYETAEGLNAGASGNPTGLYNPRFTAELSPQGQYYSTAFQRALEVFPTLPDIDWDASGCLHLINDEKKTTRYSKMLDSWGWNEDQMQIISAAEASKSAGIDTPHDALFLPQSGTVSPPKLCAAYAEGIETHFNHNGTAIKADLTLLACGPALRGFETAKNLDLRAVRGQVSFIKEALLPMKTNICYSGYVTRAHDGRHMVGSTFQRWLDHSDNLPQDDDENLQKLKDNIPAFNKPLEITGQRASVRTTSRDHFPVVGQLDKTLYISTAHGSHGILSSLMAAEILTAMITNASPPVDEEVISALSPARFLG